MLLKLLIVTVVIAPLPFASVYPWAWTLGGSMTALLLGAWAVRQALSSSPLAVSPRRTWPEIAIFVILAMWMVIQGSPLTPEAWHHPLWKSAAQILGEPLAGAISVAPSETNAALLRLMTYAGIFWIALQSCRARRDALLVFQTLSLAGLAYAAYGLAVEFSGGGVILWFTKARYVDDLTSTFEYRNAFATYAGLCLLCVVGLILNRIQESADRGLGPREATRVMVSWLAERGSVFAIATVLLITALLLSHSRGGLLSTAAALMVLFLCARAARGRSIPFMSASAAVFVLTFVGLIAISGGGVLDRLGASGLELDIRKFIYEGTIRAILDTPLLGTGAGTFDEIFALYQPPEIGATVLRAHSSYLENALELGIPAALLLTLLFAWIAGRCVLGVFRRRRDAIMPGIGVAATALVGLHAALDFTMQVPAVAVSYALIMGAACAQSWSTRSD